MSWVGARVPRTEDARLLRGRGRFADDVTAPGQLWARVVRSPVAHGRLRSVDAAAAARSPGVTAVLTAACLPAGLAIPVRLALQGIDLSSYLQPVLAAGVVRYVGEPVAVVVADDPYAAEDGAELVDVDIDELPATLDAKLASAADAPRLFAAGNVAADFTLGYGDTDAAFAAAAHVSEIEIQIGRHTGVPLEPRALLAVPRWAGGGPDRDGGLDIYGMTKVPVFNRDVLARMLAVPAGRIRAHAVDAGGGFGVRGEFYPEDFLIPWLAVTLRRPVKWAEDRAEHLVAVNHSRQQSLTLAAAFEADGRILALRADVLHDNGAYCRTHGITVPELTVAMLPGPYRVPAYAGRIRVVLTNKTPCGTYRAPGRFEGTTAREQLLDVAADQLGIDRVELRMRNLLRSSELPHRRALSTLGTDVVLDAGDYQGLLATAMAEADRLGLASQARLPPGPDRSRGVGVAMFLEKSGLGPQETADIELDETGAIRVLAGGTSLGQGIQTVLAQIAAEALRARVTQVASEILEAAEDDLVLDHGTVSVRGDPESRITFGAAAAAASPPGLRARGRFDVSHMTYPYGAHVAVVEVDHGTGQVRVLRYLVAYEVGRAVNPALVEDQLRGGVAQGIGGALLEELRYDEAGQPQATTFIEYRMPTAVEVPPVDVLVCEQAPAPGNPLGVRGAGEGGISAAGAAVACAVRDALGLAGGVGALPLTPARVRGLAESATGSSPANRAGSQVRPASYEESR